MDNNLTMTPNFFNRVIIYSMLLTSAVAGIGLFGFLVLQNNLSFYVLFQSVVFGAVVFGVSGFLFWVVFDRYLRKHRPSGFVSEITFDEAN